MLLRAIFALTAAATLGSCAFVVEKRPCSHSSSAPASGNEFLVAPAALGPYSGAVRAGEFVFVSGKIGERGQGFEHEVRTTLDAVEAELASAGLALRDVVAATVYLTDLGRYAELNALYAERFSAPYPARVCVEVSKLPGDAQVEIQVTARRT